MCEAFSSVFKEVRAGIWWISRKGADLRLRHRCVRAALALRFQCAGTEKVCHSESVTSRIRRVVLSTSAVQGAHMIYTQDCTKYALCTEP